MRFPQDLFRHSGMAQMNAIAAMVFPSRTQIMLLPRKCLRHWDGADNAVAAMVAMRLPSFLEGEVGGVHCLNHPMDTEMHG